MLGDRSKQSFMSAKPENRLFGWRAGTTGVGALMLIVFIVNVTFLIWGPATANINAGIGVLRRGDCQKSANLNTFIHLIINLLSTAMLSGSNYCKSFQEAYPLRGFAN